MKKLLIAFLLVASMCGAQTLSVGQLSATGQSCFVASYTAGTAVQFSGTSSSVCSFTESLDSLGEFAGSVFTAKKNYEKYLITGWITVNFVPAAYGKLVGNLSKNGIVGAAKLNTGTGQTVTFPVNTSYATVQISRIFYDLRIGDTVRFEAMQDGNASLQSLVSGMFSGYELP